MMWIAVIFVYLGGFASVVVLTLLQHEWMAFFVLCVLSISASPVRRAIESVGDAGEDDEDEEDEEDDEEEAPEPPATGTTVLGVHEGTLAPERPGSE